MMCHSKVSEIVVLFANNNVLPNRFGQFLQSGSHMEGQRKMFHTNSKESCFEVVRPVIKIIGRAN